MSNVNKSALVNYSSQEMYQLVTNIDDYQNFLPWCNGSKIAKDEIKRQAEGSGIPFLGEVLAFGVDVGVDATENADLRHWSTMPGFAWVGEFDVAPGKHIVKVVFIDKYGNTLNTKIYPNVVVNESGLNLLQTQAHF